MAISPESATKRKIDNAAAATPAHARRVDIVTDAMGWDAALKCSTVSGVNLQLLQRCYDFDHYES
jgi:hypothetical protein